MVFNDQVGFQLALRDMASVDSLKIEVNRSRCPTNRAAKCLAQLLRQHVSSMHTCMVLCDSCKRLDVIYLLIRMPILVEISFAT